MAIDRGLRDRVHDVAQRALVRNEAVEIGRIGVDGIRGHDDQDLARGTAGFAGNGGTGIPRAGGPRVGNEFQRIGIQHGVGREAVRARRLRAVVRNRERRARNLAKDALHGIVERRIQRHAHELPAAHLRNAVQGRGRAGREGVGAVDVQVFSVHDVPRPAVERRGIDGRPPRRGGTNRMSQDHVAGFHLVHGDRHGSEVGIRRQGVGGDLLRQARLSGHGRQRGARAACHVHETIRFGKDERRQIHGNLEAVRPRHGGQDKKNSAAEFCKQVSGAHRLPPGLNRESVKHLTCLRVRGQTTVAISWPSAECI